MNTTICKLKKDMIISVLESIDCLKQTEHPDPNDKEACFITEDFDFFIRINPGSIQVYISNINPESNDGCEMVITKPFEDPYVESDIVLEDVKSEYMIPLKHVLIGMGFDNKNFKDLGLNEFISKHK